MSLRLPERQLSARGQLEETIRSHRRGRQSHIRWCHRSVFDCAHLSGTVYAWDTFHVVLPNSRADTRALVSASYGRMETYGRAFTKRNRSFPHMQFLCRRYRACSTYS